MTQNLPYQRVLLKLSGESLMESQPYGISQLGCQQVAHAIQDFQNQGIQIGIVIGGGNIFRGIQAEGLHLERSPADQMGMLATIINGIALQQALAAIGCEARVLSAIDCPKIVESYTLAKAMEYLEKGMVVIFVGGTGNPYFTTDSAAALRACEIKANILLKATKVDGVYNKDPMKHTDAKRYDRISYAQVLAENLAVMDGTAIALCRENRIPILVFNIFSKHQLVDVLKDQRYGTLVTE